MSSKKRERSPSESEDEIAPILLEFRRETSRQNSQLTNSVKKNKGRKGFAIRRRQEDVLRVSEVVLIDSTVDVDINKKEGNNFYLFTIKYHSPPVTIEVREKTNNESYGDPDGWVRQVIQYALDHVHADDDVFTLVKRILVRNQRLFTKEIIEDMTEDSIDPISMQSLEDKGKENWLLFATLCGCGRIMKKSYIISSTNEKIGVSDGFGFDIVAKLEAMKCAGLSFWQKLLLIYDLLMTDVAIDTTLTPLCDLSSSSHESQSSGIETNRHH